MVESTGQGRTVFRGRREYVHVGLTVAVHGRGYPWKPHPLTRRMWRVDLRTHSLQGVWGRPSQDLHLHGCKCRAHRDVFTACLEKASRRPRPEV